MPDSAPVEVTNDEPIAVTLHSTAKVNADILRTQDQRRISGIWERTQQVIALSVVEATLIVIVALVLRQDPDTPTALAILFGLANLVIGFYFGRTNHQRVGGVGSDEVGGR